MATTGNVVSGSVGTGLSYEEYMKKYGEQIDQEHADTLKAIADEKALAYDRARANEQSAILDANNSYARNLSSYGAKADALASMGLTGSGYSQYLDSQAYAQNRNDISVAGAQKAAAQNEADLAYSKNVRDTNAFYRDLKNKNATDLYTYREGIFNKVLEGITNGTYTAADIDKLAPLYNFDQPQIDVLTTAADSYKVRTEEKAAYDNFTEAIDNLELLLATSPKDFNPAEVDWLYGKYGTGDNPLFTKEKYDELQKKYQDAYKVTDDMFEGMTKAAAEEELNKSWLSPDQKEKMETLFDSTYNAKTFDENVAYSDDEDIDELADEGNEFDVVFGNEEYSVESGGEITDKEILKLGKDVAENQIFGYQGRLFVKKEGRVFEIRGRGNTTTDDWSKLTDLFFEKTQSYDDYVKAYNDVLSKYHEVGAEEALRLLKQQYPNASLTKLVVMLGNYLKAEEMEQPKKDTQDVVSLDADESEEREQAFGTKKTTYFKMR